MLPKINQVLHINQLSTNEEESRKEYKSRIADLTEFYIAMEVPLDEETGKLKRLQPGEELSVYYTSEAGVKNCFNTSVIGIKDDVIRQVLIQKPAPESITKIQRRSFLRVQSQLEIAVQYGSHIHFVSLTEDVGGGGLSFVCDGHIPLMVQFQLSCWLLVSYKNGSIEHIPFKGSIVRIKALETGKQLVMLSFDEISDRDRQLIVRFCYERQMDFRKK